jgi:polyphosphate kinase
VFDEAIKKELLDYFEIQWHDNVKARIVDAHLENNYNENNEPELRSQEEIYAYLKERNETQQMMPNPDLLRVEPERSTATP